MTDLILSQIKFPAVLSLSAQHAAISKELTLADSERSRQCEVGLGTDRCGCAALLCVGENSVLVSLILRAEMVHREEERASSLRGPQSAADVSTPHV